MPGRSTDPLLEPFTLKHLRLRNRVVSTSHEPAYSEDGLPKERYARYHAEKAKGGLALTMIGGSAVVAPDSPPAFGNLQLYKDEIVGVGCIAGTTLEWLYLRAAHRGGRREAGKKAIANPTSHNANSPLPNLALPLLMRRLRSGNS